ncbi:hypothetical protein ACFOOM_32670 [Streptomyces echinoruber]|nr:hypothetical protein [Streptomyces echinoruber]
MDMRVQAGFVLVLVVMLAVVVGVCGSKSLPLAPNSWSASPEISCALVWMIIVIVVKLCRGSSFRFLRSRIV